MMFTLEENVKFHLYGGGIDMRKGINSLYGLITQSTELSATNGDMYVFISNNQKSMKILRWQKEGFILYHKKLEAGVYYVPYKLVSGSFITLPTDTFRRMLSHIKHRSHGRELYHIAILNI